MNIGLLNIRITIQKSVLSTDAIGNQMNTWQDYFSCAATAGGESGSETLVVTSTEYRVLFDGEIYNITAIDHQNYKRKSLKLWCTKVRR